LRLGCRLRRLELQAWLDCPCREKQLSRVWMRGRSGALRGSKPACRCVRRRHGQSRRGRDR
jgi:hypothetical protein